MFKILVILPFMIALLIVLLNPLYFNTLFTTSIGLIILLILLVSDLNSKSKTGVYINHNFIDCNIHIVDKAETSLVESFNSSLRSNISSLHRKTKSFNKSFKSLYNSILIWTNKDMFIQNKEKYANFGRIY